MSCVMLCHLLSSLLVQELDAPGQCVDGLLEAAGANNVLQILQHALIVLRLTLGFHHGDLLHLALDTGQKITLTHTSSSFGQGGGLGIESGGSGWGRGVRIYNKKKKKTNKVYLRMLKNIYKILKQD